jgi:hypothetical protein
MIKYKYALLFPALFFLSVQVFGIIPERAGWWKFDDPLNLTKAEAGYGSNLTLVGSQTSADGPDAGNGAVLIGKGSYYKMDHSIPANGGGVYVNEYSIQFDFKITDNSLWHSFFQTSQTNADDGDFFINTSGSIGVGAVGYSGYSVKNNEWYRLTISVKNGSFFTCYLDGTLLMSGTIQSIDGRFSLNKLLLIFADNDGEDANIYCSELAIWNKALTEAQVKESGGFGHDFGPKQMLRIPFLQAPGQNSMTICWHDTAKTGTKVDFGIDSSLNSSISGSSEIISEPFRWHTVKLTGLVPNTRYFYRLASGEGISEIYSFKTLPDETYSGKIRFLIFSDTHCPDSIRAENVLKAAKTKISELYGPVIENSFNGIFHSGDIVVSGNSADQYTTQFFQPFSNLSANIPTMVVAGNHEGESPFFYNYMKLDDLSAFPANPALNEKLWQLKVGNSLFMGMNTNIIGEYGNAEAAWLNTKLNEAQNDPAIDFVFLFFHHPPFSELWFDVTTFDGGSNYVKNVLFPVIKKYSKVQQLHTGHTHGFERGTIQSTRADGDFRIICGGGGGGALDSWGAFTNFDYNDIQIAIDHYFFQILEIDIADHSYQNTMYSIGDLNKTRNNVALDTWYKKVNQSGPDAPVVLGFTVEADSVEFRTSEFSGVDSLMTVQYQLIDSSLTSKIILDNLVHWKNVYGRDNNFNPIDKNANIDLYRTKIKKSLFLGNKSYYFRVRYRDQNLKWSDWSNGILYKTVGVTDEVAPAGELSVNQNYPNPFRDLTSISYSIPEISEVNFEVFDTKNRIAEQKNQGIKTPGTYQIEYSPELLPGGVYFYKISTRDASVTKKMIKTE